ncbi:Penicillin-binding protein 1A [Rickettsiales bacterium Ac37b]|nr:Penicillin-binding protein 1A [Rickettsiales bacterium Ac37b]
MLNYLSHIFKRIILLFIILVFSGIIGVSSGLMYFGRELPDYQQLSEYNPSLVTRLYSYNNKLLAEYAIEHRIFTPIDEIPDYVINAFIAAEDKNFYDHPGVDITSIARAFIQNLANVNQNKGLVGGSTITQQVIKNFLLTNEKSLTRKIKEAILSFRISKVYSKKRVLELYLNQIYLGNGSYGVASAALNYFNKTLSELTIEEVAFIAAMPKAPSNYDPRKNYERAKIRRDWVIDRMLEDGYLSEEEARKSIAKPIVLNARDKRQIVQADFFAEEIRKTLTSLYGTKILYEGGLTVKTTLHPQLQVFAEQAFKIGIINYDQRHGYRGPLKHLDTIDNWLVKLKEVELEKNLYPWTVAVVLGFKAGYAILGMSDGTNTTMLPLKEMMWAKAGIVKPSDLLKIGDIIVVEKYSNHNTATLRQIPEVNGGIVVLEPVTGRILAMVGGFNYDQSKFNRVTQAKRQSGSAFKPFAYLAALESGFTPDSIILDGPIELSQGPGLPMWRPKNYTGDFLGPTTLRVGLEKSRNTMTVRLAQILGIKKLVEITKRFGIEENPTSNFSLVLGAGETTLLNITNAYAMIANGGKRIKPYMIEYIQDKLGKTIYRHDDSTCEMCYIEDSNAFNIIPPEVKEEHEFVTDPRTAYQMISLLEGVIQNGTGRGAKKLGKIVAGKTGTTNDSKDVWFIGFSPGLVVGTYLGYDQPKSLGSRETGATSALPIFVNFMENALKDQENKPFIIPEGIKLVKIHNESSDSTNTEIYEAYKVGTEPNDSLNNQGTTYSPSIMEGTGGIY